MSSAGWNVVVQTKTYGKYIHASLGLDGAVITLGPNPMKLELASVVCAQLNTPEKVDRVCFLLNSVLEEFENQQSRRLSETDPLAPGASESSAF